MQSLFLLLPWLLSLWTSIYHNFSTKGTGTIDSLQTAKFSLLYFLTSLSLFAEWIGYTVVTSCVLVGLMFPREGKTARTLLHKLTYAVNTFILPAYFGYTGFQFDLSTIFNKLTLALIVLMILVSAGTRIVGTLTACHYLKITWNESLILAFLLNLKGNYDLILINTAPQPKVSFFWCMHLHFYTFIMHIDGNVKVLDHCMLKSTAVFYSAVKFNLEIQVAIESFIIDE